MNLEGLNWLAISPEIFVLSMLCVTLVVDLFVPQSKRWITYGLAQLTLVGAIVITVLTHVEGVVLAFDDSFVRDPMADLLKVCLYVTTMAVFLYSRDYLAHRGMYKGEYYVLGLFAVLGMMIMVSGYSFLTLYLGLELLALSLYAMVAFGRDSVKAAEAAMKYFVLGAIASGMLLYGMSIIYGLTGSLGLIGVHEALVASAGNSPVAVSFGLVFVVVGVAFKLGAVPFHMWIPDVYEGAPTSVTLFVGSVPKLAAFAFTLRILAEGLGSLHESWQAMLIFLAVLSLGLGNIVAIAQTNLKRMLAYSTVSHVGFIVLGVLAGTREGYSASLFYTITYVLTAAGAFGMIALLSRKGLEAEDISDYRGLSETHPWQAFLMMLLMLSMAGVPPLVGFYAKLVVLESVVAVNLTWLAVYAVLMSVVGAFYYLRVIKVMYFDQPVKAIEGSSSMDASTLLSANGLAVLILGLFPGALMALCLGVF